MAEVKTYLFDYKEIAEALIKKQGVHEGLWGIYMEFGIGAANITDPTEKTAFPAAIIPVLKIGIQRFDHPNPLTVDAAETNPPGAAPPKSDGETRKARRRRRNMPKETT